MKRKRHSMSGLPTAPQPEMMADYVTVDNPCTASKPLKNTKILSNQWGPLLGLGKQKVLRSVSTEPAAAQ